MAPALATYEPRDPSSTLLYKVIADHLETFLASLDADPDAKGLPAYIQREFYDYFDCLPRGLRTVVYVSSVELIGYAVSSDRSERARSVVSASGVRPP